MIFTDPSTYLQSVDPARGAVDAFDYNAIADEATERAKNWLASSAFKDKVDEMNFEFNQQIGDAINAGRDQMGNIQDTSNMINAGIGLAGAFGKDAANKIGSNNTSNLSSDSVRDAFTNGLGLDLGIDYNSQFMNTPGLSFNPFSKI